PRRAAAVVPPREPGRAPVDQAARCIGEDEIAARAARLEDAPAVVQHANAAVARVAGHCAALVIPARGLCRRIAAPAIGCRAGGRIGLPAAPLRGVGVSAALRALMGAGVSLSAIAFVAALGLLLVAAVALVLPAASRAAPLVGLTL